MELARPTWTLAVDETEQAASPDGGWTDFVRFATAGDWGVVTARRADSNARLSLRFNRVYGLLEYRASDDGPVWVAQFSNRHPITEQDVELPCCGCGIPLVVRGGCVLRKVNAVRLFLQYLDGGALPTTLEEPPQALPQLILPGTEAFLVPAAVFNAVDWQPP